MSRNKPPRREEEPRGDAKIESQERLQKVLAAAGVGSRRDCEELITQGRVEIDRQVVTELGTKVDPLHHEIRVDGVTLHRPKKLYFAVNKPEGVVTTNFDPSGRTRVIDLVPTEERVFAVGRLDRGSEGLILVTNDGELANRVTHPRYGVEKLYHVRVEGSPSNEQLDRLRRGVHIAEGVARVQSVKVKGRHKNVTDLEIVLNEGKNREIRRILVKIGHKVLALKRISVGPVKLGELKLGASRKLMPQEVEALFEAAKQRRKEGKRHPGATKPGIKPIGMKPVGGQRPDPVRIERPQPVATNSPPKIDLASLLNPKLAPKHAMPITAPVAAVRPEIGDVLGYNESADRSVAPLETPQRSKRRRPLREYETDAEPIEKLDASEGRPPASPPVSRDAQRNAGGSRSAPPRGKKPRSGGFQQPPAPKPPATGGRRNRGSVRAAEGAARSERPKSGPLGEQRGRKERPAGKRARPATRGEEGRPTYGPERSKRAGKKRPRPGSARPGKKVRKRRG